jgi:NADH-quinone oxidoreductase subunit K
MQIPVSWYLILSACLFIIGAAGVLSRRNMFVALFSIELMMNAVNINLVAFSRFHENIIGQNFVLFTIVTALYRNKQTLMVDLFGLMKG